MVNEPGQRLPPAPLEGDVGGAASSVFSIDDFGSELVMDVVGMPQIWVKPQPT